MKCAVAVFIVFTLFVFTEAAIHVVPRKSYKYDGNATCFMSGYGEFNEGEIKRNPFSCQVIQCETGGDLSIISCGAIEVEPPCYIVKATITLPYPECCNKVECPKHKLL